MTQEQVDATLFELISRDPRMLDSIRRFVIDAAVNDKRNGWFETTEPVEVRSTPRRRNGSHNDAEVST
jgi:hypothetical protein